MGSGDADRQRQAGRFARFCEILGGQRLAGRRFDCCVSSQSVPRLRFDGREGCYASVLMVAVCLASGVRSVVAVTCIRMAGTWSGSLSWDSLLVREGSEATAL
jgi:hypothetical protein